MRGEWELETLHLVGVGGVESMSYFDQIKSVILKRKPQKLALNQKKKGESL